MRSRRITFALLAAACVLGAAVSAITAIVSAGNDRDESRRALASARPKAEQILASGKPFAVVRTVDKQHAGTLGQLAVASLESGAAGEAVPAGPICGRVAFGAGRGLCLYLLGTQMEVRVLGARLNVESTFELAGIPSRARISPDGRWGGVTAFVVGHAYASPGQFSTATTLIDLEAGKPVADLEKDFTVTRDGKAVTARDRNFWGLTFADDGDTFYATMASDQKTWLIKGSIRARSAHTIHENVECPSLSPDGTRIGYKKAIATSPSRWRFHVLDLATGQETALAETRNVDDQLFWLDDEHLLYGFEDSTWVVNADGSGAPKRWLQHFDSATVQRTDTTAVE